MRNICGNFIQDCVYGLSNYNQTKSDVKIDVQVNAHSQRLHLNADKREEKPNYLRFVVGKVLFKQITGRNIKLNTYCVRIK